MQRFGEWNATENSRAVFRLAEKPLDGLILRLIIGYLKNRQRVKFKPMNTNKPSAKITAQLEFTETGYLKAIYLNAENNGAQETLERALNRLIKPGHFSWVRRLLSR